VVSARRAVTKLVQRTTSQEYELRTAQRLSTSALVVIIDNVVMQCTCFNNSEKFVTYKLHSVELKRVCCQKRASTLELNAVARCQTNGLGYKQR